MEPIVKLSTSGRYRITLVPIDALPDNAKRGGSVMADDGNNILFAETATHNYTFHVKANRWYREELTRV